MFQQWAPVNFFLKQHNFTSRNMNQNTKEFDLNINPFDFCCYRVGMQDYLKEQLWSESLLSTWLVDRATSGMDLRTFPSWFSWGENHSKPVIDVTFSQRSRVVQEGLIRAKVPPPQALIKDEAWLVIHVTMLSCVDGLYPLTNHKSFIPHLVFKVFFLLPNNDISKRSYRPLKVRNSAFNGGLKNFPLWSLYVCYWLSWRTYMIQWGLYLLK